MKIQKLSEVTSSRKLKALVYGAAGSGKTRLISTLPGDVLIVDVENGLLSLLEVLPSANVVSVRSAAELTDVFKFLKDDGGNRYQTVAIDSVSEMIELIFADEMKLSKSPMRYVPEARLKSIAAVRAFKDLPISVLMTAKQVVIPGQEIKEGFDTKKNPDMFGIGSPNKDITAALPHLFDEVYRLVEKYDPEPVGVSRWLQTRSTSDAIAKSRIGCLDPYEPADIGAIMDKIK